VSKWRLNKQREIFKGRSHLRFPRINKRDPSRRDQDHSRPLDKGKVAWRIAMRVLAFRSLECFKVLRRKIIEVAK
jgi:hypothetical protein